jgi:hypothetical protein
MENSKDLTKATVIDGIAATEAWDQQGEKLVLNGADISEMTDKGYFNDNHGKGFINLLGKITFAKKIMSEKDISDERQRVLWEQNKSPYLYVKGYLFDEGDHPNAKALATIMHQFKKMNSPLGVQMSVEGKVVDRNADGVIKQSLIRNVALTVTPANDTTGARVISDNVASEIINKCKEIGANVEYASTLIKNINDGTNQPIKRRFIEIPDDSFSLSKLESIKQKVEKITDMVKMLSVGYGGAGAPASRTGGSAMTPEHVEDKLKVTTFSDKSKSNKSEEDKQKRKEILKSLINRVQKSYPNLPYEKVVEYCMEVFRNKYEK